MKSQYQKLLEDTRAKLAETSPSFCLAKWTQSTIHLHRGLTHSCHHPKVHKIPLSELDQSPSALHNTNEKLVAREQMLRGEFPEECVYCWNIEKLGDEHFSDRILKSKDPWSMPHLQEILADPLSKRSQPRYLEVSFSKACNFKCSYCSPSFSSKWSQEILKFGPYSTREYEQQPHQLKDPFEEENNPYIEAFWKWWPEIREGLHTFRITGGEPLLAENTFKLLEEISNHPLPGLELCVNTNLGAPVDRMDRFFALVEKIAREKKVKKIQLYTSIEAVGERAEYIRHGMVEKDFWNNLEKFLAIDDSLTVTIMATYNLMSVTSFQGLLEKVLFLRKKHSPPGAPARLKVDISYLRHPYFLAANVLPLEMTKALDEQLAYMEKNKSEPKVETRGFYVFEIVKMARLAEWAKRGLEPVEKKRRMEEFFSFITEHDRRRGTSFLSVFPEYRDFFVACGFAEPAPAMIRNRFPHFSDVVLKQKPWLKYIFASYVSVFMASFILFTANGSFAKFMVGGALAAGLILGFFFAKRVALSLGSGFYGKTKNLLAQSFSEELPLETILTETNHKLCSLGRALRFIENSIFGGVFVSAGLGISGALLFSGAVVGNWAALFTAGILFLCGAMVLRAYFRFQADMSAFQNYFRQMLIELEQKPADVVAPEGEEAEPSLNESAPPLEFYFLDHAYDGVQIFQKCNYRFDVNLCLGVRGTTMEHVEGLYRLLKRKKDPKDGEVRVFGRDIRNFSRGALEKTVKILGPGEMFLPVSLRKNLEISHPNATQKDLQEALSIVAVDCEKFNLMDKDEISFFQFRLKVARAVLDKDSKLLYFRKPFSTLNNKHHQFAAGILQKLARVKALVFAELDGCERLDCFPRILSFRKAENPVLLHQKSLFPFIDILKESNKSLFAASRFSFSIIGHAIALALGFSCLTPSRGWLFGTLGAGVFLFLLGAGFSGLSERNRWYRQLSKILRSMFDEKIPTVFWEKKVQQFIQNHNRQFIFWFTQLLFGQVTFFYLGVFWASLHEFAIVLASVSLVGWLYFWNKMRVFEARANGLRGWIAKKIAEMPDEKFIEIGSEEIFHYFIKTSSENPVYSTQAKKLRGGRMPLPPAEKVRPPLLRLNDLTHGSRQLRLFERFNFTFANKEAAAVVGGELGCVDELERILGRERDPQCGSLQYAERDIRDYRRTEYERAVRACTAVEPLFFSSPISQLRFSNPGVSRRKVGQVLSFLGWTKGDSANLKRLRLKAARLALDDSVRILLFRQPFVGLSEQEIERAIELFNKLATLKQLVLFESDCVPSAQRADKILFFPGSENPRYSTFQQLIERQQSFRTWVENRSAKNERKIGIKLEKNDGTCRTLWWNLQHHEMASVWWKNLCESLAAYSKEEAEQRFFGWRCTREDQQERVRILNRSIDTINAHFGDRYHIAERAFVDMDQDILNRLHHHFEILMGQSWNPSKYIQGLPPPVLHAVRTINNVVHDFEYAARIQSSVKGHRKVYGLQLKLPPGRQIPLPDCAFSLFDYENQVGDIVTDYCQLGKTWAEAFFDQDEDILISNISPLRYYSSSLISNFHELPREEAEKIEQSVKSFIRSKNEKLGNTAGINLDPDDPKNALGHILLARLDYHSQIQAPDEEEFSEFERIRSVELKEGAVVSSHPILGRNSYYE